MTTPSTRAEQVAQELDIPRQEAAMLCCEVYGRGRSEALTREIEEILDIPEEDGD